MDDETRPELGADARLDELTARLDRLEKRMRGVRQDARRATESYDRLAPQIASLETRVESLRGRLDNQVTGSDEETAAARNVLDEVRREHERIRLRFSSAARYEARLGTVEKTLAALREGRNDGSGEDGTARSEDQPKRGGLLGKLRP